MKHERKKILDANRRSVRLYAGHCRRAGFRLAQLQLVHGEEYAEASQRKTLRTYDENASRGEITDRNGVALASNSVGFALVIDYYTWDRDNQNDVILRLTGIMKDAGASYNDTLPLSASEPFVYTYSSKASGDGSYLYEDFIAEQDGWPADPAPAKLMDLLCEKYGVDDSLTAAQKRAVVGVRFEMERRDFSSYTPFTFASDIDVETVSLIAERSHELPGVNVEVEDVREYTTDYAAHVLGYMGLLNTDEYAELKDDGYAYNDSIGKTGMEKALESYLRGIDGERSVETNIDGIILSEFISKEPEPGDNCVLTIDLDLQKAAEDALEETILDLRENGRRLSGADAEGGAVVVMDVDTGEVLALASYPTYSSATVRQDIAELNQDPGRPMYNRAVQGVYPPGSTFKMVTAVAGLEEGVITPETRIRDQGRYMYYAPDYTPACWIYNDSGRTHGNINVSQAIQYSCNYFFYEVSRILGIDKLNEYAKHFGLGQPTGLELGEATRSNLAGPESREASGGPRWELGETIPGRHRPVRAAVQPGADLLVRCNHRQRRHRVTARTCSKRCGIIPIPSSSKSSSPKLSTPSRCRKRRSRPFLRYAGRHDGRRNGVVALSQLPHRGRRQNRFGQTVTRHAIGHGVFVSFAPYDDPEIAICVVGDTPAAAAIWPRSPSPCTTNTLDSIRKSPGKAGQLCHPKPAAAAILLPGNNF